MGFLSQGNMHMEEFSTPLRHQLLEIYEYVNMDLDVRPTVILLILSWQSYKVQAQAMHDWLILNTMLLTLAKIIWKQKPGFDIVIFPETRVPVVETSCSLKNGNHEIFLTGVINYMVIQYRNKKHMWAKGELLTSLPKLLYSMFLPEWLLGASTGGPSHEWDISMLSEDWFFFVEVKQCMGTSDSLGFHAPEAVGQAITVAMKNKSVSLLSFSISIDTFPGVNLFTSAFPTGAHGSLS